MTQPARGATAVAATTLLVDATAAEVATALRASEVPAILLKGSSVERALYPHGGIRSYSDVDLLVDPARLDDARTVLAGLGFAPLAEPRLDGHENHARTWTRRGGRVAVDLHYTLPWLAASPTKVWRCLERATEPIHVAGVELRALAAPALALHLALHAAAHGPREQEPLHDLERAVARFPMAVWEEAQALANELDALPALRAALSLVPGGNELADALDLPRPLPPDLALATTGPAGALTLHRIATASNWRERLRIVGRQIVPPREYMHAWSPRARKGTRPLLLAYLHRWLVVAARLPRAFAAVASTPGEPVAAQAKAAVHPASPVLAVSRLERRFGSREVVRNLDVALAPGDRVALWGPNGSGKTTAIRCIAGSLAPSRGTIAIGGHPAGSLAARSLLGLSLAQERSFYMRLSGRSNLLFFARLRYDNDRDARRAIDVLADELELDEILATRADACSAGMLQQLAFARALLGEPALLLLDEPTRSLDAEAVERLWVALDRRPHAAVVIASHNLEDAERCGRRIEFPT